MLASKPEYPYPTQLTTGDIPKCICTTCLQSPKACVRRVCLSVQRSVRCCKPMFHAYVQRRSQCGFGRMRPAPTMVANQRRHAICLLDMHGACPPCRTNTTDAPANRLSPLRPCRHGIERNDVFVRLTEYCSAHTGGVGGVFGCGSADTAPDGNARMPDATPARAINIRMAACAMCSLCGGRAPVQDCQVM